LPGITLLLPHGRMRSVLCAMLIAGSVIGTATSGLAQSSQDMLRQLLPQLADDGKYKREDPWWSRNFQGFDFLEPLIPRVAASRGDVGNIVLDSGVPYSLLTTEAAHWSSEAFEISRRILPTSPSRATSVRTPVHLI